MHRDHTAVFETPLGAVLRCTSCERLLVRFGNALLSLDRLEFARLRATIGASGVQRDCGTPLDDHAWSDYMVLHASDPGMAFIFTRGERAQLEILLEGAALLLELSEIGRER